MKLDGGCSCGLVRYTLNATPLIVHACHCRDCQRITGSAFIVNIWIEREFVELKSGELKSQRLATGSGKPQEVFFCGRCGAHVWSKYQAAPGDTVMVRVGTLDDPTSVKPDVHIFTRSKMPWLTLPDDVPSFEAFYSPRKIWRPESLARFEANRRKAAGS
jgi:hypothetical protein